MHSMGPIKVYLYRLYRLSAVGYIIVIEVVLFLFFDLVASSAVQKKEQYRCPFFFFFFFPFFFFAFFLFGFDFWMHGTPRQSREWSKERPVYNRTSFRWNLLCVSVSLWCTFSLKKSQKRPKNQNVEFFFLKVFFVVLKGPVSQSEQLPSTQSDVIPVYVIGLVKVKQNLFFVLNLVLNQIKGWIYLTMKSFEMLHFILLNQLKAIQSFWISSL